MCEIITATRAYKVAETANQLMQQGWKLKGELIVTVIHVPGNINPTFQYTQVLIKE